MAYERALEGLEGVSPNGSLESYFMACRHARVASLIAAEPDASPPQRNRAAHHLERAMAALRQIVEAGPDHHLGSLADDPALAPLRSLPEFQRMFMDPKFPADPFAPSP